MADPYAPNKFKSCSDKTTGTYQEYIYSTSGVEYSDCNRTLGKNRDPQHDFSGAGAALDTNDNGVAGETFYMKLPAYDGDYLGNTEGGEVVECPECVPTGCRRHS